MIRYAIAKHAAIPAALLCALVEPHSANAPPPPSCTQNAGVEQPLAMTVDTTYGPNYIINDGRGTYHNDRPTCLFVGHDPRGIFSFGTAAGFLWRECKRVITTRRLSADFDHPVPNGGGTRRGIVTSPSAQIRILARFSADSVQLGLRDMVVGESLSAVWTQIHFTESDLRIVFNPDNSCRFLTVGRGSTRPTVTPTSLTHWEVDFPIGTIGRLLTGDGPYKESQDQGLYYFPAHLTRDSR